MNADSKNSFALLATKLYIPPAHVQNFLLQTSILERLCGSLCDAILNADFGFRIAEPVAAIINPQSAIGNSHATLEHLERANLFI